jgi:hypothetical protein
VVVALAVPQLQWYSGCAADKWSPPVPPLPLPGHTLAYAADEPGFGPLDLAALAAATHTTAVPIADGTWRLEPAR